MEEVVHCCTDYKLHLKASQDCKGYLHRGFEETLEHEFATVQGKHTQFGYLDLHSQASLRLRVFQVRPRKQEERQLDNQEATEI
jgi:hypothetical protein